LSSKSKGLSLIGNERRNRWNPSIDVTGDMR
jgi:hypothetical protein